MDKSGSKYFHSCTKAGSQAIIKTVLKNKLVKEFGEDFVSKLLKQFDDVLNVIKNSDGYADDIKKAPCPSCEGVIKQFREMFPDIKLNVEYMYQKEYIYD